jgi:hypothetical protein
VGNGVNKSSLILHPNSHKTSRLPRDTYSVATVGVSVEKDTQALKTITVSKDRSWLGALLGKPNCETISNNAVTLAIDFKLEIDLEVGSFQWLLCGRIR